MTFGAESGVHPGVSARRRTKTLTDPRLCSSIVDRLTFGGNVIETRTDSYRLAQAHAAQQD